VDHCLREVEGGGRGKKGIYGEGKKFSQEFINYETNLFAFINQMERNLVCSFESEWVSGRERNDDGKRSLFREENR
jgi:hypothetical protein